MQCQQVRLPTCKCSLSINRTMCEPPGDVLACLARCGFHEPAGVYTQASSITDQLTALANGTDNTALTNALQQQGGSINDQYDRLCTLDVFSVQHCAACRVLHID